MKKTVLALGSFIVLGALCYVGQLSGQTQPAQTAPKGTSTQPPPARTRIALLNLTYVIKNYEKYKNFQQGIKSVVQPFQDRDAEFRRQLDDLRKKAEEHPDQRAEIQRQAKKIQSQIEDNSMEAKIKLGKQSDEEMKILFMDVYQAVHSYARSHDFELVLHYNDAVTKEDFLSARNIARKLNTGALMPLYMMDSMDISRDVVKLLNYNVNATSTTGATQPTGGQR